MNTSVSDCLYEFKYTPNSYLNEYKTVSCKLKEEPKDFIVYEINDSLVEANTENKTCPEIPQETTPIICECNEKQTNAEIPQFYECSESEKKDILEMCNQASTIKSDKDYIFSIPNNQKLSPDVLSQLAIDYPYVFIQSRAGSLHFTHNPAADELEDILGTEETLKLLRFIATSRADRNSTEIHSFTTSSIEDKEKRRKIHLLMKMKYPFVSTKTADSSVCLLIRPNRKRQRQNSNSSSKKQCTNTRSNTLHYVLHFALRKENTEQLALKTRLCQLLQIHERALCFAGIKDKRAITYQYGSVRGKSAEQLLKAVHELPNIEVGDFYYDTKDTEIGHLWGNHFIITLRDIQIDRSLMQSSLHHISTDGFVNYYGNQRLGTRHTSQSNTARIGHLLLLKKYKQCLQSLITPSVIFTDSSSTAALEELQSSGNERAAIHLVSASNHNLLTLLRSIRRYGCLSVLLDSNGDVDTNTNANANANNDVDKMKTETETETEKETEILLSVIKELPCEMLNFYVKAFQSLLFNKVVQWRIINYKKQLLVGDLVLDTKETIHIITENDIKQKTYTIYDVVLPLFGYDICLPQNEIGQYYNQLLQQYLHCSLSEITKETIPFALSGSYRTIIAKPYELKYSFDNKTWQSGDDFHMETEESILYLSFKLKKGLYATTLLHELLNGGAIEK